jgi:hypothetical protein
MVEIYNGALDVDLKGEIRIRTGTTSAAIFADRMKAPAYGNEQVRHLPLILFPSLAILAPASLNVSDSTMYDHSREEDRIKPWEGRPESCNQTPG